MHSRRIRAAGARFYQNSLKALRFSAEKTDKGKCPADSPVKWDTAPGAQRIAQFLENAMGNTTRITRRDSTRVKRAETRPVLGNALEPLNLEKTSVARLDRVAAAKAKISSVGFDLDTDFRKAMHKLLEDFGA